MLYQVALAVLSPADIAQPIRGILSAGGSHIEVLMDEVVGFDLGRHVAHLRSGLEAGYDFLVLASAATHSYFGHEEWAQWAPGVKTIDRYAGSPGACKAARCR